MFVARVLPTLVSLSCISAAGPVETRYDMLLHSSSIVDQRDALEAILAAPERYLAQIRRSLQTYPIQLDNDPVAANRAIYVAALIRDRSFIPILTRLLGNTRVLDECLYDCAPVFALSIYANFAGWKIPAGLDSRLTTVADLRSSIALIARLTLENRPLDDFIEGPWLEEHKKLIEGKTEDDLIEMAGPGSSLDARQIAAYELRASVSRSKNRIKIYLLAMNDIRDDASREYLNAVHVAAYRAELAKTKGQ